MPPLVCAHHRVREHRDVDIPALRTDPDLTAGVHCAKTDEGRKGEGENRRHGGKDGWRDGPKDGQRGGWRDGQMDK